MSTIDDVRREARSLFQGAKGSHDWEHTERVLTLALHIGRCEGADLDIVHYAALLHDIGRGEEDRSNGRVDHAALGAQQAAVILTRHGLAPAVIARVAACVETHRFRDNKQPQSLEARVLFDADKLDAIGAVGIGRAFLFAGEVGAKLHNPGVDPETTRPYTEEDTAYREFLVKLRKVKDKILTNEGRRLAQERHDFMVFFFERLNREVEGAL